MGGLRAMASVTWMAGCTHRYGKTHGRASYHTRSQEWPHPLGGNLPTAFISPFLQEPPPRHLSLEPPMGLERSRYPAAPDTRGTTSTGTSWPLIAPVAPVTFH